jgi:cytochrome bd-type quinol oxidase subunit 2
VEAGERRNPRGRERASARRAEKRRRGLRWVGRIAVLAAVFFFGLALGKAVEGGPSPDEGSGQTLVRTVVPATLTPQETVTVTVSKP